MLDRGLLPVPWCCAAQEELLKRRPPAPASRPGPVLVQPGSRWPACPFLGISAQRAFVNSSALSLQETHPWPLQT